MTGEPTGEGALDRPAGSPPRARRAPLRPLERDEELRAIARSVDAAATGNGTLLVVTGPAGTGKSTLLQQVADRAEARTRMLRARGVELESGLPFGIVREIVESPLLTRQADERDALLSGPASPLRGLLEPDATAPESWSAIAHGLYWTLARLAHERPLCVLVDDLHWADEVSSRALAYVARRLAGHRILLVVAVRDEAAGGVDWSALARQERATVLRPAPLSPDAACDLVARVLPSADPGRTDPADRTGFAAACHRLTGGNPQLLVELLAGCRDRGIVPSADGTERLRTLTPAAVSRIVVDRVARLGDDAVALARAVAVLEEAQSEVASGLAELPDRRAGKAIERLVAAEVLANAEPLRFAHPLARAAIVGDLSHPARDRAHRRAAELLADRDPETAAQHLLRIEPCHAGWAARALVVAARTARDRAAPEVAVRLLERALREQSSTPTQIALGEALLAAGDPRATTQLERALQDANDPATRARLALLAGQAQVVAGDIPRSIQTMRRGLDDAERGDDPGLVDEMMATIAVLAVDDPPLRERAIAHARARTGDPRLETAAAVDGFCRGRPIAEVIPQARAGLATLRGAHGGEVLPTFHLAIWALAGCDELVAAEDALESVFALARDRGSRVTYGIACFMRSWVRWRRGDLPGTLADAEESLAFAADGWGFVVPNARWIQAEVALLCGDDDACRIAIDQGLAAAERTQWRFNAHWLLVTRSALRMRHGDAAGALEDALQAGAVATAHLSPSPALHDWRGHAIRAALALERPEHARELAADGLQRAVVFGAPRTLALARRNAALCCDGDERIVGLQEAAETAAASPSPLVRAQILLDLGGALRRNHRRADARLPLQQALDLARRSGATGVVADAQAELDATGARRRTVVAWGIEALTPREHELARLAAQGLTNVEIAERLFITRKTVETHLSTIYRKLEIGSRGELPDALAGP